MRLSLRRELTVAALVFGMTALGQAAETSSTRQAVHRIAGDKVGDVRLGAKGYDLTRLFPYGAAAINVGDLVMGSPRHTVVYEGAIFQFVNKDGKASFEKNPEKYMAGTGGYCLLGTARRAEGDPTATGPVPRPGDPAARTYANGRWHFQGARGAEVKYENAAPEAIEARTRKAAAYFDNLQKVQHAPLASR